MPNGFSNVKKWKKTQIILWKECYIMKSLMKYIHVIHGNYNVKGFISKYNIVIFPSLNSFSCVHSQMLISFWILVNGWCFLSLFGMLATFAHVRSVQMRSVRVIFICSWKKFECLPQLLYKCLCNTGLSWPGQAKLCCCPCWLNQNYILVVENRSPLRWVVEMSQLYNDTIGGCVILPGAKSPKAACVFSG